MATLTVHHADDLDVVAEITAIATGQGGTDIDATETGVTTVEFPSEANARTVAAVLAQAAAVTTISIEAGP
jgi:hypothetical protein